MSNQPQYQIFEVGRQIIPPGPEGTLFEIDASGPMLVLKYNRPTASERRSIKSDVFRIRLAVVEGVIFLLFRFGTGQWMDAPYNARLSQYTLTAPPEGMGLLLHIMLVDSSTGILQVNRAIGLSTEFSRLLLHAAAQQPELGPPEEYYAHVAQICAHLSTTELLEYEVTLE